MEMRMNANLAQPAAQGDSSKSTYMLTSEAGAAVGALAGDSSRKRLVAVLSASIVALLVVSGLLLMSVVRHASRESAEVDPLVGTWISQQYRVGGQSAYTMQQGRTVALFRDGRAEIYDGHELVAKGTWLPSNIEGYQAQYYYVFLEDGRYSRFVVDSNLGDEIGYLYAMQADAYTAESVNLLEADEWILFRMDVDPDLYWSYLD